MNLSHIRLQYEILNKTLVQLGQENDIPVSMLEDEATKGGWVQWWPESDLVVIVDDMRMVMKIQRNFRRRPRFS